MDRKNETLEVKKNEPLHCKLSQITRKKPQFAKVEKSSVLDRVKAFMPELKKGEVDLWAEMKQMVIINRNGNV